VVVVVEVEVKVKVWNKVLHTKRKMGDHASSAASTESTGVDLLLSTSARPWGPMWPPALAFTATYATSPIERTLAHSRIA